MAADNGDRTTPAIPALPATPPRLVTPPTPAGQAGQAGQAGLDAVRQRLRGELLARVAGPDSATVRSRIHDTPGSRWFGPDRPIRVVHSDASIFVGGLRALLLQSLHPLAMAAAAAHSGYRGDPWGRLQRTSTFLAVTTYGTAEHAQQAVDRVRAVHEQVRGTAADGRPYAAADPHLLRWVHVAEVDSFLRAHRRFGAHPLDEAGYDGYVADAARVATALGVPDPPRDQAELAACLAAHRRELRSTPEAREPPATCSTGPRSPGQPGRRTRCWPRAPSPCSPGGPVSHCGCPICRCSRRPASAWRPAD
jgi:uncharacterized protein (DUF2236 family)